MDRPAEPIHRWLPPFARSALDLPLSSTDLGAVGEDRVSRVMLEKEKTKQRRRRRSMPPALEENHEAKTLHQIHHCRHRCWIPLPPLLPNPAQALALDPPLPGAMAATTGSTRPPPSTRVALA